MEVILQEDYPSLGYVGDRVQVRPGFARNFLIPRGIAVEGRSANARALNHKLQIINAKKLKMKAEAETLAKRIEGLRFEFILKMGEQGKSYGSVTSKEIESHLKDAGFEIDRKQVRLLEPLKTSGEHKVLIKLHSEVSAPILVVIQSEKQARAAAKEREEAAAAPAQEENVTE